MIKHQSYIKFALATFVLLVFLKPGLLSQTIIRQSINSFGGTTLINGMRISETAGQAFNTETAQSGNLVFHPGFQQQMLLIKNELVTESEEINVQIFPNPAYSELWIKASQKMEKVIVSIIDMNGKIIKEESIENFQETYFDVSGWSDGIYAIKLLDSRKHRTKSSIIIVTK